MSDYDWYPLPDYRRGGQQPWAMMPLAELVDRLAAISAYHSRDARLNVCQGCGLPSPCLTSRLCHEPMPGWRR